MIKDLNHVNILISRAHSSMDRISGFGIMRLVLNEATGRWGFESSWARFGVVVKLG